MTEFEKQFSNVLEQYKNLACTNFDEGEVDAIMATARRDLQTAAIRSAQTSELELELENRGMLIKLESKVHFSREHFEQLNASPNFLRSVKRSLLEDMFLRDPCCFDAQPFWTDQGSGIVEAHSRAIVIRLQ